MFCQLEALRYCLPSSVRRFLLELPVTLDETYERILREIQKSNRDHARRLLHCLVVAVRPLQVQELADVLAIDFEEDITRLNPNWRWEDEEQAVLSTCSSLVSIVAVGDSRIVQFSHFSVKEFLTSERLAVSSSGLEPYHVSLEPAHTTLAQACLDVLLHLDDHIDRDNLKSLPLALYAAQHWATHAWVENVSSYIMGGMERLFEADNPHFATWLWIYNEDRPSPFISTMRPEQPEAVPLYYASRLGFRDLAEHLIAEHPEHVLAEGGYEGTPIHAAARAGHANTLSLLLDNGADVNSRGINGGTPLHRASWKGELEVGECLLDHGADINARDCDKWTPLFPAVSEGHVAFTRMLLERGADINFQSVSGRSPLHWAVSDGEVQDVQLLLDHGADVNARNRHGETPSQLASLLRRQEILKLLSMYGAESAK